MLALILAGGIWLMERPRADLRAIAGCYALTAADAQSVLSGATPPEFVSLDLVREPYAARWFERGAMRVRLANVGPLQTSLWTLYWARGWGESVRVMGSDSYTGVSVTLRPAGRDLVGSAQSYADDAPRDPPPPRPVIARRIPCPAFD
jgi:hypothetical protein